MSQEDLHAFRANLDGRFDVIDARFEAECEVARVALGRVADRLDPT